MRNSLLSYKAVVVLLLMVFSFSVYKAGCAVGAQYKAIAASSSAQKSTSLFEDLMDEEPMKLPTPAAPVTFSRIDFPGAETNVIHFRFDPFEREVSRSSF